MTFFLIVPSVIIVGVVLVHGIANRLGLRINYIAPVICAVLSMVSDAGAIFLSPAPDKFYFMRLGGFILVSAAIGTAVNYFLVRREVQAEAEFAEQVRTAYQEETEITVVETAPIVEKKILETVEKPAEIISKPIKKVDLVKKSAPRKKISESAAEKKVEPAKIPVAVDKVTPPVEKTSEGKVVKKFEPEKISKPVKVAEPVKVVEKKIPEPKEIILSDKNENLDSLLDSAYSEKSQGHVWQAIAIYKKALEKYRADEYAPFVAIDLGNIYKEQAMYAKAIKIYEDALELPAVKRNFSTLANFKKNIVYLKSVQSVLLRHQALTTPFSKISKVYLQEIESEFQAAQLRID